ncbi:MAG: hypothetical protein ACI9LT_000673 [Pseudoalteromonas distincta]|jgi:hypothetical protein
MGRAVDQVARLAGIDPTPLRYWTQRINASDRSVYLAGEELLLNDWTVRRRRWCDQCFREDRERYRKTGPSADGACWHRALWDVSSVGSCPIHMARLLEECSSCGRKPKWREPSIDRCRCGADLASGSARLPLLERSAAAEYLAGRLGYYQREKIHLLDELSLKDVIANLEKLGRLAAIGFHRRPGRAQRDWALDGYRDLGVDVMRRWPNAFDAALDQALEQSRNIAEGSGIIAAYGWVYADWAITMAPSLFADAIKDRLRHHAIANGVIAEGEVLFGKRAAPTLNLTEAARFLGLGYRSARVRIAAEGLLALGSRRGVASSLSATRIQELREELSDRCGLAEAAGMLGTGRGQVRELIAEGLLTLASDRGAKPSLKQSDIQKLFEVLHQRRRSTKAGLAQHHNAQPLPRACQHQGVLLAVAVASVIGGKVPVVGVDDGATGLSQFLVLPSDVAALRSREMGLSNEAVAARLAIHPEAVRDLRRLGFLVPMRGPVDPESVHTFRRTFVAGTELALQLRTSPRAVYHNLGAWGLEPTVAPPSCRAVFFDRDRAAAFLDALGIHLAPNG